jgi:hypothetical protein
MHPMFVSLFLEADAEDLEAEELRRRRGRALRNRPALAVRAGSRGQARRPQPPAPGIRA